MRKYTDDVLNETDAIEVNRMYGETLQTMTDKFETRVIIGEIDIDAGRDSYVQKWPAAGGKEYLAEVDKAPVLSELLRDNGVCGDDCERVGGLGGGRRSEVPIVALLR